AQPPGQYLAQQIQRPPLASGPEPANQAVIDLIAGQHAQRPAERSKQYAIGGQPNEAEQRPIAQRLDADDEIANRATDQGAAEEHLLPLAVVRGALVAEDAEEHPTEQAPQGPENGVEVDAVQ